MSNSKNRIISGKFVINVGGKMIEVSAKRGIDIILDIVLSFVDLVFFSSDIGSNNFL